MNDSTILMRMGAEEAIKELGNAIGLLMDAEHTPDEVEKKYLEEKIDNAQKHLNNVNNWLYAISEAGRS